MDRVLHFVLALAVVAILALLVSSDRKNSYPLCYSTACYRSVTGVVLPELRRWFRLREGFSEMFEKLLGFANEGTNFVFGSMNDQGGILLPESAVPNRLYLCTDRYSPAHSRVAGDHPRNWFPALQSQRHGQTGIL